MKLIFSESPAVFHYFLKRYVKSIVGYLVVVAAYLLYSPTEFLKKPPLPLQITAAIVIFSLLARIWFIYSARKYTRDEAKEEFLKKQASLQFWFVSLALFSSMAWSALFCVSISYLGAFK